jgi:hypothetical protein
MMTVFLVFLSDRTLIISYFYPYSYPAQNIQQALPMKFVELISFFLLPLVLISFICCHFFCGEVHNTFHRVWCYKIVCKLFLLPRFLSLSFVITFICMKQQIIHFIEF